MHFCREHSCHTDPLAMLEHGQELILQRLEKIMTAQDDVNAAVAAIQELVTDLAAAVANIQAQLAQQGASVDTSQLDALVAQLPTVQASVDALETPAAPPAA
jgi:hypothetical protein